MRYKRSSGTIDASLPVSTLDSEQNFMHWLCFRSYKQLLIRDGKNSEETDAQATSTLIKRGLPDLKLPSFAATNSLVLDIDTTLTNIQWLIQLGLI